MNPAWIAVGISAFSFVAGIVNYYTNVRTEMVRMRTELDHMREKVAEHANSIPKIFQLLSKLDTNVEVIKARMESEKK